MVTNDPDATETARSLAARAFNEAWELLERPERTPDEDAELLTATCVQRYLWSRVGDARNRSVAEWQLARVAAVLGLDDLARHAAERSLSEAENGGLGPFYVGYAHESRARAAQLRGDAATARRSLQAAQALLDRIDDADERALLAADLDELARRGRPSHRDDPEGPR